MITQDKLQKLDTQNVLGSIKALPLQIRQVITDFKNKSFPNTFRNCDLIAISGMGGSIYNYSVIQSLFADTLKKPFVQISGYKLPFRVLKDTLFIASSYSGSTEETVATTQDAIKNDDAVTAITCGGKLATLMKKNKLPYYHFEPKHNPSNQPRCGLGYMVFGPILMLHKLNYLDLDIKALNNALDGLENADDKLQSKAQDIVQKLKNRLIVLSTAEHLQGAVHIARNQLNETAKAFAEYHLIPELNHHLMEGMTHPKGLPLFFIFYKSKFFDKRNQRRIEITKKVLAKQDIDYIDIEFQATNKIEEFLKVMQLNSYISFFLGIDYGVDPGDIPWVTYFKKQLEQ